MADPAT